LPLNRFCKVRIIDDAIPVFGRDIAWLNKIKANQIQLVFFMDVFLPVISSPKPKGFQCIKLRFIKNFITQHEFGPRHISIGGIEMKKWHYKLRKGKGGFGT
jgi:hypothetical protein